MRGKTEYAVRHHRHGQHDQVRMFQTRYYAERYMRWIVDHHGDELADLRLQRRAVGPWEPVEVEL
jgi:hypothetical protein